MKPSRKIDALLEIMARLRDPEKGCPWDVEQSFHTIAPYTIEEAYEVADAVERNNLTDLEDELGDLLLQVVFHARMAEERGAFDFGDVCHAITSKLIRRHPHVFGDAVANDPSAVRQSWQAIKDREKEERDNRAEVASILDDVPLALPALTRAVKLQARAGRVGFDWNEPQRVIEKVHEELEELSEAADGMIHGDITEEVGDLLFAVANLARHLNVDPESALRQGNEKFRRRFAHIEQRATESGSELGKIPLDEMESWWLEAKTAETGNGDYS